MRHDRTGLQARAPDARQGTPAAGQQAARPHPRPDGEGARARGAPDHDVQAGRRLLLDRRPRRGGVQRPARPADQEGPGPRLRLPPPPLPPVGDAARAGRGPDRRAPPDEEHGDRPVLGRPQLRGPLLQAGVERRPGARPIEVQYSIAPGTALAQKRHGGDGITIVTGGDAGTAEGDFATCLVWSSRPGNELPMLIIVTNNQWGISTAARRPARRDAHRRPRQGVRHADHDHRRQRSRRRPTSRCKEAMDYVRTERKPFLLEAIVSRLYGHSSRVRRQLRDRRGGLPHASSRRSSRGHGVAHARARWTQVRDALDRGARRHGPPGAATSRCPTAATIWNHIYAEKN